MFILRMQNKDEEVQREESFEKKMEVFDNLLMESKDALQGVKEEIASEMVRGNSYLTDMGLFQKKVYLFFNATNSIGITLFKVTFPMALLPSQTDFNLTEMFWKVPVSTLNVHIPLFL